MDLFAMPDYDGHEQVSFFNDVASGMRAIIAIHWGGPIGTAGGGCRMQEYADGEAALRDVLRLSKAMSYKLAIAGLPGGGAKSCMLGRPRGEQREAWLLAFGRAVESLGGHYMVGEDVGTTVADMEIIARETSYVVGRVGDTAPIAAWGVFVGLRAAVERELGRSDLSGLVVAIQGMGGVGMQLGRDLVAAGAHLVVTDIDAAACERAKHELGARIVAPHEIWDVQADVLAPCALGSVLDDRTIPRLKARFVAGGANNQLAEDRHARMLAERGIVYLPDFVINAGGAIAAAQEVASFDDESASQRAERARAQTERIVVSVLDEIFEASERERITPHDAAVAVAKRHIAELMQ
jgi:leucine dehydrogenase